jgi:hypothetical protein
VTTYFKKLAKSSQKLSVRDAPRRLANTTVVLTSPQFPLIAEKSKLLAPEPIDSYELSSKLSYFLWNNPLDPGMMLSLWPVETLRTHSDAEGKRTNANPNFSQFAGESTSQCLSLDKFQVLERDRASRLMTFRIASAQ